MITALYAGSFDPVTFGHLSVIKRAAMAFDQLIIGVGHNPEKKPFIDVSTRVQFIQEWIEGEPSRNMTVESYAGLTTDFAKEQKATILIRGIREEADLKNELYIARINRKLTGIETIFFGPEDGSMLVSSTFVRQVWQLGQDPDRLKDLVPQNVIDELVRLRTDRKHLLKEATIKARGGDNDEAAKDVIRL